MQLEKFRGRLNWGAELDLLGTMEWDKVRQRTREGELLVVIRGVVHKLDSFVDKHPGGRKILEFWNGRDATNAIDGEVYRHSKNAFNMMAYYRIAKLKEVLEWYFSSVSLLLVQGLKSPIMWSFLL